MWAKLQHLHHLIGTALRHVVLTNTQLHGPEYGMLRDFEDEIVRLTNGVQLPIPLTPARAFAERRASWGTRMQPLRRLMPKSPLAISADVVWLVLMGPENFALDTFSGWQRPGQKFILYVFDSFAAHMPLLTEITRKWRFDVLATSFPDAKLPLEQATGQSWQVVPQGVKPSRFQPSSAAERLIGFSAHGRRHPRVHAALLSFCREQQLYYEYSTWTGLVPGLDVREAYAQYAWHVAHSCYHVSFPTNLTHPERAEALRPITCRWFEAAAAATPILGQVPDLVEYAEILGSNFHVALEPNGTEAEIKAAIANAWSNRTRNLATAERLRAEYLPRWTWESRVQQLLGLLG